MRVKRERIFAVCVNGGKLGEWREAASGSLEERQHSLATDRFVGAYVKVTELYLGGAKAPAPPEDEASDGAE